MKSTSIILIIFLFFIQSGITQSGKIFPDDLNEGSSFGFILDMYEDELVVGSLAAGAYIYKQSGNGEWEMIQKIENEDVDPQGGWVSIGKDWLMVAANNDASTGSVSVFERGTDKWELNTKINGPQMNSNFGWQIDHIGDIAIIGDVNGTNSSGIASGLTYIYELLEFEGWNQTEILGESLENADFFGSSVYINESYAAVTSRFDRANTGALYVFEKQENNWVEIAKIVPEDVTEGDLLGYRVAGDENQIIVSSYAQEGERGAAYIYTYMDEEWVQTAKLIGGDSEAGDWFGASVNIDGDRATVGARFNAGNSANSGSLYLFEKEGDQWVQSLKIVAPDGASGDQFGAGHVLSENHLFIGAPAFNASTGAFYYVDLNEITSLKEIAVDLLEVFPNPTSSYLNIGIKNEVPEKVLIFNASGNLVSEITTDNMELDVSQLEQGGYYLKAISKSGKELTSKFIKM